MSVSADTVVHTLNGDKFAIDLAGAGPTYVYTWDEARVTVGQVVIEFDREHIPTTIELDDGKTVVLADTRVILRSGGISELASLVEQTSLMPLYLKLDGAGYPMYKEPGDWNRGALTKRDSWNWRRVNRMVAEWKLGRRCAPGDIVRFIDGNKRRCTPDNLEIDYKEPKPRKQKAKFAEPIFAAEKLIKKFNHKIVSAKVDISREMFSIRGIKTANLGVSGIFISTDTQEN